MPTKIIVRLVGDDNKRVLQKWEELLEVLREEGYELPDTAACNVVVDGRCQIYIGQRD